jgi:hypothetical protein
MITKYKLFEESSVSSTVEYEKLHRELNDLFTMVREKVPYLKNIWFTIKYDELFFELKIIWFYSSKTTKLILPPYEHKVTLYEIIRRNNKLSVSNYIENEMYNTSEPVDLISFIKNIFYTFIPQYLNYHSYPNLKKMAKSNEILILDYDKFLEEFEEELEESKDLFLYKLIDSFYRLLNYADVEKRKEVEKYLKDKYEYIVNSKKYNI